MNQGHSASNSATPLFSQTQNYNVIYSQHISIRHLSGGFPPKQMLSFEDQRAAQVGAGELKSVITAVQTAPGLSCISDARGAPKCIA